MVTIRTKREYQKFRVKKSKYFLVLWEDWKKIPLQSKVRQNYSQCWPNESSFHSRQLKMSGKVSSALKSYSIYCALWEKFQIPILASKHMGTMQYFVMPQSFDGFGVPIHTLHRVIISMGAVGAQHPCPLKLWVLAPTLLG